MKAFIRENPTITFGLGLPLLLVIVFLLLSGVPALLVAPPQYDVLYATSYYDHENGLQFSVVNQEVKVVHHGHVDSRRPPRLWRYNPTTGAVKEIAIMLPTGLKAKQPTHGATPAQTTLTITPINVPDLAGLAVDSSSIAPDGYEFSVGRDRYSGNVFGGLFYSSRSRHEAILRKNGRSISIPNTTDRYYSGTTRFIGWIIPQ